MDVTIPDILVIIALIFGIVVQVEARGRDLSVWAIILICVALLWSSFA